LQSINALSLTILAVPPAWDAPSQEERFPDPDEFDGTRANLRTVIDKLRLNVGGTSRYPTEQSKLRYAFSGLKTTCFWSSSCLLTRRRDYPGQYWYTNWIY
jgi:hypothetical protein